MLKDTVSIDVQGFFDNNNNFILKEIGIVFEKDPNLNNSFLIEPPYDFTFLNTKSGKTAIWLTNSNHKIFWNDGQNSFPQTRKYLGTITSEDLFYWVFFYFYISFTIIGNVIQQHDRTCSSKATIFN